MKLISSLSFIVLGIFIQYSAIASEEHLIWGYSAFSEDLYSDDKGQPKGRYADIIIRTLDRANVKYKTSLEPNRRARKAIADGKVTFFTSVDTTVENPNNFHRSQTPIDKLRMRAYWIDNQLPITQPSDLIGQSVILITSFQYAGYREFIENQENNVALAANVDDHRRALIALSLSRAEYMLGYEAPITLLQQEMKVPELRSSKILESDIHLYLNKSVKNSKQIMHRIDKAYAELFGPPL